MQPWNVESGSDVTEFGTVNDTIPVHKENIDVPIVVLLYPEGNVILKLFEQP